MQTKMSPKIGSRKLSSSLEISRLSPRCGQDTVKKAFLVKILAKRFQDEAQDAAKIVARKL